MLSDMESRHLKPELRITIAKKFHVRQNYQVALNKRINDHLSEFQLLEVHHSKEKFEAKMAGFEGYGSLKIRHSSRLSDLSARQVEEHHAKKQYLRTSHENEKSLKL